MTELSFSLLSQLFQVLYVLWKTGICCNFVVFYITTINHLVGNYYESNLLLFAALELLLSVVILFPNILFNFFFLCFLPDFIRETSLAFVQCCEMHGVNK